MTLCIAGACRYENTPSIVHISDTRREKGLSDPMFSELKIGSDDADKTRVIGRDFIALVAGNPTAADELLAKCEEAVYTLEKAAPDKDTDLVITRYFEQLKRAARDRKREIAEHYLAMQTPFYSLDDFLAKGKSSLPDAHYNRISDDIRSLGLGADVIIAGFHDDEAMIVRLDALGNVHWEDGYSVIGSGMDIALAFLCQNDYEDDMPLQECVFRIYEAKSAAQRNRTVGVVSYFEILIQGRGKFDISDSFFKQIKSKRRMRKVPIIETEEGWITKHGDEMPTTRLGETVLDVINTPSSATEKPLESNETT